MQTKDNGEVKDVNSEEKNRGTTHEQKNVNARPQVYGSRLLPLRLPALLHVV